MKRASLILILLAAASAASAQPAAMSIYTRIGGDGAIGPVVDEWTANIAGDRRVNRSFARTDFTVLRDVLKGRLCKVVEHKCKGEGADALPATPPVTLTHEEWVFVLDDLSQAMTKFRVPATEQADMLAVYGPLEKALAAAPPPPPPAPPAPPTPAARRRR